MKKGEIKLVSTRCTFRAEVLDFRDDVDVEGKAQPPVRVRWLEGPAKRHAEWVWEYKIY